MNLSDALATTLRDWDVKYLFGVGGANIEHLLDSVHRLGGDRLHSIMAKSEVGASFMADSRARIHGTLGVCYSTSGGGMMNLAVGVAEAYAESVPLLAIVGQIPQDLEGNGGFQDSSGIGRTVDAVGMWGAISKHVSKIESSDQFWTKFHDAVREAMSGRPGPSVLLIPRNLFPEEVEPKPEGFSTDLHQFRTSSPISNGNLDRLIRKVEAASNPVMIIGSGVQRSANPRPVYEFARRAGMRIATTLSNHTSLAKEDPSYLGSVGIFGHPSVHSFLNDEADLVLIVGAGMNAMTRMPLQSALSRKKLICINIDVDEMQILLKPEICMQGDAGEICKALLERWRKPPAPIGERARTRYHSILAPALNENQVSDSGVRQSSALEILQHWLPRKGSVLFDAGNCAAAAMHHLDIPAGVSSSIALGMGGMGYSIAAAVGAQLGAEPGSRSLVLCGDGAFLMTGLEIHTAIDLGLPILFVVFNNNMHGMCVTRQQLYFSGRIESSRYSSFSPAGVARGLGSSKGLWSGVARSDMELMRLLAEYHALPNSIPGVLELELGVEEIPPFLPFLPEQAPVYEVVPC